MLDIYAIIKVTLRRPRPVTRISYLHTALSPQNLGPSSKDFCVQKTFAPVTCGVEPGAPPGMAARRQPSVNVIGHHRVPALSNAPVAAPRPRGLRVFQDVTAQHVNNASRPNKKVAPPVVVAASRPVLGDITANVLKPSTRSAFHATGTTATTTGTHTCIYIYIYIMGENSQY